MSQVPGWVVCLYHRLEQLRNLSPSGGALIISWGAGLDRPVWEPKQYTGLTEAVDCGTIESDRGGAKRKRHPE